MLQFFIMFARLEFALKTQTRFRKKKGGPDWEAFAKCCASQLVVAPGSELDAALQYLRASPPAKEVVRDGHLEWESASAGPDVAALVFLVGCLKTIRNNLFHGGKFPGDFARDILLLRHSVIVMHALVTLDQGVEDAFLS